MTIEQTIARYVLANRWRLADPESAWGRCVLESAGLLRAVRDAHPLAEVGLLSANGQNYPGREHWALVLDMHSNNPRVVDVTARQFSATVDYPWSGDLFEWADNVCEWFNDYIVIQAREPDDNAPLGVSDGLAWVEAHDPEFIEPGDTPPFPWKVSA